MAAAFKRAQKSASYLRMGLAGPSGSGKTYTALLLATELAGEKGVAVIDTERGSASKYSDIFTFDVLELDIFHPNQYIEAIQSAQEAGYGALVIDSLSHAWNGTGGLLELHENVVKRQQTKNSYTAWAEITPIQNRLINAITGAGLHIIATMRSKTEYALTENKKVEKLGMAPIQRDGMEYEFDVFAEMTTGNTMLVQKSRCSDLSDATIGKPGKGVADTLKMWLRGTDGSTTPVPRTTPMKAGYATYTERPLVHTDAAPANTKAAELQQRIEAIEAAEWEKLDGYRRDLEVSDEDYAKAKKAYKTVAEMAAALERLAERKRVEESQEAVESEPVEEQAAAEDEVSWKALERRSLAVKLHKSKADWEALLESTGGSYKDTLARVEQAEANKGRH